MQLLRGAALVALTAPSCGLAEDMALFTFGAGDVTGSYHAVASAICDQINQTDGTVLRCSPDPTSGSNYNLDALRRGELDVALVQSDWQRRVYDGTGTYAAIGPMTNLRSVMGLYQESLTILARRDAGIESIADLAGKRVDIGHPASGRRGTIDQILRTLGFDDADFDVLGELPAGVAIESICTGGIDATLLIVGHPNNGVARALADCDAVIVPVAVSEIEQIVLTGTDIRPATIPSGTYPQLEAGVTTVAVTATIVTRDDVDPAIVTALVTTTLADLAILGRKAPVLSGIDPAEIGSIGLTAPLHDAARAALAAAGLD